MKAFRRRLSRDRTSKSYIDQAIPNRPYSEDVDNSSPHQPYKDSQYASDYNSQDKLQSSRPVTAGEPQYSHADMQPSDHHHSTTYVDEPQFRGRSIEPAPDALTRAFNDALRPLHQQIAELKAALDDYAGRCEALEAREGDMIAWIDKRGFRAGESFLSACLFPTAEQHAFVFQNSMQDFHWPRGTLVLLGPHHPTKYASFPCLSSKETPL